MNEIMRGETDKSKLMEFMENLGRQVQGAGRIYITGGGTAVLYGWREMTIDVDIKAEPEPAGFFEAIVSKKLVEREKLWELFLKIEKDVIRYPAVDLEGLKERVARFCQVSER